MKKPFYINKHNNEQGYVLPYTILFILLFLSACLFFLIQLQNERLSLVAFIHRYEEEQLTNRFILSTFSIPLQAYEEGTFQTNGGTIHYKVVEPYEKDVWLVDLQLYLPKGNTVQKQIMLPVKEVHEHAMLIFNGFYGFRENDDWKNSRRVIIS
ncbi:hypothetical protein [Massilibacterium senegalense]|uniref:hypothetical protein n=1 Tax=Massilibacterium senegalense TaxID=1632858 RepID=UPI000781C9E3|nr:hypothetical protein [Massilibacterium senegalense]